MTEASPETSIKSVEEDARDRADFIKRLFAVAVSVGFASQLIQLQQAGGWLSSSHFWFLIVGLFLIINSWEHDFRSLRDKADRPRAYADCRAQYRAKPGAAAAIPSRLELHRF